MFISAVKLNILTRESMGTDFLLKSQVDIQGTAVFDTCMLA